jgi:hypothetical protein
MLRAAPAIATVLLFLALPGASGAQETQCTINMRDPAGRAEQTEELGASVVILHDPFTVTCTDGAELRANSGRVNRTLREAHFVGSVFFRDAERTLTANEATYNSGTARLWALGDVVLTGRADGSTLRAPELEYFRATDERPLSQLTATRRPRLSLPPREGAEERGPMELVADRILVVGDDDLSAFGAVVISRSDFDAAAAEARYNSASEDLELRRDAVIRSEEYELSGEVVQARLLEGSLEHAHSRTNAVLRGEDLTVGGDELQLFFADELLRRAVATVAPGTDDRASAFSRTFRMDADSLDATFVERQLDIVHAVGRARAESIDTTRAPVAEPLAAAAPADDAQLAAGLAADWIRGDTITGFFVPADRAEGMEPSAPSDATPAAQEAAPAVELRRLVARGAAQSFYRVGDDDAPPGERRNINFLVGDVIELDLLDGDLQLARVAGLQRGVYLEADAPAEVPLEPAAPPAEAEPPGGGGA